MIAARERPSAELATWINLAVGSAPVYVCLCKGLTESDVRQLAPVMPPSPQALIAALGLDDEVCCGRCAREVDEFAALAADGGEAPAWCPRGCQ